LLCTHNSGIRVGTSFGSGIYFPEMAGQASTNSYTNTFVYRVRGGTVSLTPAKVTGACLALLWCIAGEHFVKSQTAWQHAFVLVLGLVCIVTGMVV